MISAPTQLETDIAIVKSRIVRARSSRPVSRSSAVFAPACIRRLYRAGVPYPPLRILSAEDFGVP